jgi:hypothetical protein
MMTTAALALALTTTFGSWYVVGNTDEIGNWDPLSGALMHDDGVAPDVIAGDNILSASVTFDVPDSVLVEYKIADGVETWYGTATGNNMQLDLGAAPEEVLFYLDLNDRSGDGWHPQAGWTLSDDHVADHTWVAVGGFQDEAGEAGDWVPTSTVTEMHDDGLNGDAVAGDGIYTFQFVPTTDLVAEPWKVVRQGEWVGSIKFGANGWSFDPGDSWNLTLNANAGYTVVMEFDAALGWLRHTVVGAPMSTLILEHDVEVPLGESFDMIVKVINNEDTVTTADVWVDVVMPNGLPAPVNPVAGPVSVTLPGNAETNAPVSLPVPMSAPLGDYQVQTRTGIHGMEIWDTQQVTTTVVAVP